MKNLRNLALISFTLIVFIACDPKPAPDNLIRTVVIVNGERDTVISDPGNGDGNTAISESCIKSLIGIIHRTDNYQMLTTSVPPQNMIYYISWATSKKPMELGHGRKVRNGIAITVSLRSGGSPKKLNTFLYNNENGQFYVVNDQKQYEFNLQITGDSLKNIRNSCFCGVVRGK